MNQVYVNPFDVMIDGWSFEIAKLTSNGTGLVSVIFLLNDFLSAFVLALYGSALVLVWRALGLVWLSFLTGFRLG